MYLDFAPDSGQSSTPRPPIVSPLLNLARGVDSTKNKDALRGAEVKNTLPNHTASPSLRTHAASNPGSVHQFKIQ